MHLLVWAAAVTPSPSDTPDVDANLVTPGPWGFAVMAVLGVAVILLVVDMLRRIRRARYRSEVIEDLDAELSAKDAGGADAASRPAEQDRGGDQDARPRA
ncbi:hypothetical protein [Microbacterium sp. SORGH_AS_0888]|uniref:hypothetical protein n=1 Tax=Microbacterium sp. SORGH_AS_0888 TaxID=3041791 RepID=UPI00278167CA|nr:hypothetical protein [Microbacterium sp. SORGH_AS_0888]MDQ1128118.1 hypothetical protein [Microbacterium sp. SORGH_AS_0888]